MTGLPCTEEIYPC